MKVKMFNVDFGESIMISSLDNYENLLIDYGSETNTNISYIESQLNSIKSNGGNIDAMITHFHDDHINGFINLSRKNPSLFNKVYIPNVFSPYLEKDFNTISYVEIEVILFFLIKCKFNKGRLSLFEMLKSIIVIDGELHIVQRGDIFTFANIKYVTLWPNISEIKFMKDFTEDDLKKFLNIIGEDLDEPVNLSDEINKISSLLSNTYFSMSISDHKMEVKGNIEELEKRIEKLSKSAEELNGKLIYKTKKDKLDKWIKKLGSNLNKISIVFQNEIDKLDNNILMTGDIDFCRLNWIIENKLNRDIQIHKYFNIIKAPHHGTKTHFIDNLPTSKNIIISNGRARNSKRGKVSSSYNVYRKKGALIRCTNSIKERCEFLDSGSKCRGICNKHYHRNEILIY
ncbi:hypothetical protein [Clostridium sp.]|uniref:hypothetical protein n=1 Tax=Clostridium sp. TaxID=1506 RepID=UPI00290BE38B|nr:hypothetical protein [Clostridium sp.]MDU6521381.1 hypothetical protein [Clostridium sp.]